MPYAHRDAACTHQVRRVFDNCYLYNGAVTTGHWVSLQANQARSRRDLAAAPPRRTPPSHRAASLSPVLAVWRVSLTLTVTRTLPLT